MNTDTSKATREELIAEATTLVLKLSPDQLKDALEAALKAK